MSDDPPRKTQRAPRFDEIEQLLANRGHGLGAGRVRVAAGRSGIAVGFPREPMVHVSWPVIVALGLLFAVALSRRSAHR